MVADGAVGGSGVGAAGTASEEDVRRTYSTCECCYVVLLVLTQYVLYADAERGGGLGSSGLDIRWRLQRLTQVQQPRDDGGGRSRLIHEAAEGDDSVHGTKTLKKVMGRQCHIQRMGRGCS